MADSKHGEKNLSEESSDVDSVANPDIIAGPPDGGLLAWTQCVGSFFLFFNSWGLVNTFGESADASDGMGEVKTFFKACSRHTMEPACSMRHSRGFPGLDQYRLAFSSVWEL